jgi:hypothetical protein
MWSRAYGSALALTENEEKDHQVKENQNPNHSV